MKIVFYQMPIDQTEVYRNVSSSLTVLAPPLLRDGEPFVTFLEYDPFQLASQIVRQTMPGPGWVFDSFTLSSHFVP